MTETLIKTEIAIHNAPDAIYAALSRVFGEVASGEHKWTSLTADGVKVTLFKTKEQS